MAKPNKTVATEASIEDFLAAQPEARAAECRALIALMSEASGHPPRLWGKMVGFGRYHYVYDTGREGEIFEIGFASAAGGKGDLTLYLNCAAADQDALLARLGKHKGSKACVYLKQLDDADPAVLRELLQASLAEVRRRHVA